MRDALVVARLALREALRRKVFAVVVALTLAFGALFWWGSARLFHDVGAFAGNAAGLDATSLAGATLLGMAMFGTLFLGTVLATFLTLGAVRGDAERGLLQPLIVRPLGRGAYLLGRFLAAATVSGAYVAVGYLGAVVVTGLTGGWWPQDIAGAGARLVGAVVIIAAIGLLGSVFLSSTANGIAVLMVFGAGLLAGLLGSIGDALGSRTLSSVANAASWALPFEGLYRDALRVLVAPISGVAGAIVRLGPLGGSHDAGPLLAPFAAAYVVAAGALAAWAFARRDL